MTMVAAFARSRILVSRVFAVGIFLFVAFTAQSFAENSPLDVSMEISGLLLLSVASLGRLWALMYISGNKTSELVVVGPYSLVRHPLYLFSLIGAVGLGLASENVVVLALIVLFYALYYPFTMLAEEQKLTRIYGDAYLDYMRRVPRLVPMFAGYREPRHFDVKTSTFVRNFSDAMWFVWAFALLHLIEQLHIWGILPTLWRIP
jgi:protein-S-isoprenylcysteine O-methyltransferase Ste14